MKRLTSRKEVKLAIILISYATIAFFSILCYRHYQKVNVKNDSSLFVTAIKNLYGEWEIVEDYGYHGISTKEREFVFDVGDKIMIDAERFVYGAYYDLTWYSLSVELTDSAKMEQFERMEYPQQLGFGIDNEADVYAKVYFSDHKADTHLDFYFLNDYELIFTGDPHYYYRALKRD